MTTPSNWARVRALFHAAVERPPEERSAFLRHETGGDEALRREVESLLAAHVDAEGFLSVSPIDGLGAGAPAAETPRLPPGTRLGVFEILGLIGVGGMGEVHRARDTRLDRTVAIKVLSRDLASDPRSRERFEREARLISKLTHPHICTLHDVGSVTVDGSDVQFLVMELVEGETLAARLRRGPLPVDQALKCALEIVEALAAAHALGIVHRDLKPANIMLTKSGVKLLDFGLARLRPTPGSGLESRTAAADDALTAAGMVLGTIPYMAPEQLRGEDADARTDLFAFGAVCYEMLTGERAFAAASDPALIAAILEREPAPLADQQPLTPPALGRLVTACLAKDPAERWQHAQDVALVLRDLVEGRSDGRSDPSLGKHRLAGSAASRVARHWRLHAAWAVAAVVIGVVVWATRSLTSEPMPPVNPRPVIVLMDSPLPGRVYDPRTLAAGGTNADDVTDALRDLPVLTFKENTSPIWHREEQVREQNPDLVISHLSCLYDERIGQGDQALQDHLFNIAQSRLTGFFGFVAATNPRTRFLVYSRGRIWPTSEAQVAWAHDIAARFPRLSGRLFTMVMPGGGKATFRDPATVQLLQGRVKEILGLH